MEIKDKTRFKIIFFIPKPSQIHNQIFFINMKNSNHPREHRDQSSDKKKDRPSINYQHFSPHSNEEKPRLSARQISFPATPRLYKPTPTQPPRARTIADDSALDLSTFNIEFAGGRRDENLGWYAGALLCAKINSVASSITASGTPARSAARGARGTQRVIEPGCRTAARGIHYAWALEMRIFRRVLILFRCGGRARELARVIVCRSRWRRRRRQRSRLMVGVRSLITALRFLRLDCALSGLFFYRSLGRKAVSEVKGTFFVGVLGFVNKLLLSSEILKQ